MVGAEGSVPCEPPPDYEYAVTHPEEDASIASLPEYRVAVDLPSYQQAVLDKGNCLLINKRNLRKFSEKLLAEEEDPVDSPPPRHSRRISCAE